MKLKRKLILLLFLTGLLPVCIYLLPAHIRFYDRCIFYPLQNLRIAMFDWLPLSIGDVLYVAGGLLLLITLVRWISYVLRFRRYKLALAASVLSTINSVLAGCCLFMIGWGANYSKEPLAAYWGLKPQIISDHTARKTADSLALLTFNQFLVDKLNSCAPGYNYLHFREVNRRAIDYYQRYTNSQVRMHGLDVKYSLFGYFMDHMAIDGYYNPFTGEGQMNDDIPAFMMPFVVTHEMAHQAGIAAEGDANLMAYRLCTAVPDTTFNYSGYLNIWLYANSRLYRWDSVSAKKYEMQLNKLTAAHLDTLEQLSKKFNNEASRYGSEIYDSYLKMQHQKEGIRSYGNVLTSARLLEKQRESGSNVVIDIP